MNKRLRPDKKFLERFNQIIEERQLTHSQVAREMGVERKAVLFYSNGYSSPQYQRIKEFCKAYHVSADWLLGLKENRE